MTEPDAQRLAERALDALWALLDGFQAVPGDPLAGLSRSAVYDGLLTVLLRIIFLALAGARGLLPGVEAEGEGLWSALHRRFGAVYAQRGGDLFAPAAHPFLAAPLSDACVRQVLAALQAYRVQEVEQLGAAYESLLGFEIVRTEGPCLGLRPRDIVVDVGTLLAQPPGQRGRWLRAQAECVLSAAEAKAIRAAKAPADVAVALARKLSLRTPRLVPAGRLLLQPGPARRRSGSHYTPRALSAPVVAHTLSPLLSTRPAGTLRVCDPAMGSGAFLLEACRQLAAVTGSRREVATRCLFGVDKSPLAVALAKLSLWLFVADPDLPLTFLDHALKHGDTLVGLTRAQIQPAGEPDPSQKAAFLLSGFFSAPRRRGSAGLEAHRTQWAASAEARTRSVELPLTPMHWELAFPVVFQRENPGFDAVIGNPPFLGGSAISGAFGGAYLAWLLDLHPGAHGNGDLVAHFFRRGFTLLRDGGCMGLIATNTINEGDTRDSGLAWICTHGGSIYRASRRVPWPGDAAVVVSEVFIHKGAWSGPRVLDGRVVARITAFLFHQGGHEAPRRLPANRGMSFIGSKIYGQGFLFDDTDPKGIATPLSALERVLASEPRSADRIAPYIGGAELNSSPTHAHHRYVINFGDLSEEDARSGWPMLMDIVEQKVKPERARNRREARRRCWWRFGETSPALYRAVSARHRVLAVSQISSGLYVAFLPPGMVYSHALCVFPLEQHAALCAIQSRPHEIWARFFGSSLEDRLRYTPSDCFETFPFPAGWLDDPRLESAGHAYASYRASLMADEAVRADVMGGLPPEGLTKTYNRFHDPACTLPGIVRLRRLHAGLDAAMLSAYGWSDIVPESRFLLDYPIDVERWSPRRKKPYRFRWPDAVQDEVLARLMALNQS